MKNYLFIWTSCLVLCLVGWSCSPQELENDPAQNAVILTVSCTSPNTSRTETKPGVQAYNENLITTLDYFFYPKGGTASNAVLSERIILANNGVQNGETVRITIDEEDLSKTEEEVLRILNSLEKAGKHLRNSEETSL